MKQPRFAAWPLPAAQGAAAVVSLTGLVVLLGYRFDLAHLKSVIAGLPKMSPATALSFVLSGVALLSVVLVPKWLRKGAPKRSQTVLLWVARICSASVIAFAAFRLVVYLTGWHIPLDMLGFHESAGSGPSARMSPATATNFVLLGGAILASTTRRFVALLQPPAVAAGLLAWLGLSHYLYGGQPLLPFAQMAVHTAVSFLLLCTATLCSRPDVGLVKLLVSDSPGGLIARRLVPAALVLPFLLGWLRLLGQRAGWYGTEAGVSLYSLANVLVFGALIWANAELLHRSDLERQRAQRRVAEQLEKLDLLHRITRAVGGREDLHSIYQVVLRDLEENLSFDFGCICSYDALLQELLVAHVGARSQALALELALTEQAHVSIDANGLSRCVAGQLVYEPDISEIKMPFPERLSKAGLRSIVCAPLLVESKVFGVFVAARREANSFSSAECEFLRQLSEHVALAAHQAQLHSSLQQAYDDLRQTQQAVLQQERLRTLGQMASGIAHDINNALSPMAMYTEMLLEQEKTLAPKTRRHLEMIQRATDDVAKTVSRMREFYRQREPQTGLAPVQLNNLLQQVTELTQARWRDIPQQHGVAIELRRDFAATLPEIMGAESEIREALTNLIFNAVDAMPEGGTLTLRTRLVEVAASATHASNRVALEVADTGVGMDDETRRRCLEPFFTTKGERGTGLGLAMVYGVAQRHSADLEIESSPHGGTTVRLAFAVAAAIDSVAALPAVAVALPSCLRILVIDDDPLVIRALRDTLETDRHSVVSADGGQNGIDAFSAARAAGKPFDAVITDLGMPRVDGRKVAAFVKGASPLTPVILLTGWGQRLAADGDIPPHVDYLLAKPPKIRELREALAAGLSFTSRAPLFARNATGPANG